MDKRAELLQRVRDDTTAITELVEGGSNVPLEQYVDKPGLNALCDSLALDPEEWQIEDLERILIIRDGLYELRHRLRDKGDDAEHSVDRLLSAMDRLYADLERAFRELNQEELKRAQNEVAALQRSAHVSVAMVSQTAAEMQKEAGEVLVQAHTSIKIVELNLLKIDRSNINFEVLRSIKLSVQRLSASVFAIKLSLEQNVVYQGIFKLLSEGADRFIEELKALVKQMQQTYQKAGDFISQITKLAEKGTRFTKLVAEFLHKAFIDSERKEEVVVRLSVQVTHQSTAVVAASAPASGPIILAGRHKEAWTMDPSTGRIAPRFRLSDEPILSMAHVGSEFIALGSEGELQVLGVNDKDGMYYAASARGKIHCLAVAYWGAKGSAGSIITGSREGMVTRWTLAGGLTQFEEEAYEQVGRRVHALAINGNGVIAATGAELVFLNADMRTQGAVKVPFEVNGMDVIDPNTVVICGEGRITHVNLEKGSFSRIITASNIAEYTCVAANDMESFFFGTKQGRVGLMDLNSGEELGNALVGFEVRGILKTQGKLVAYGGDWAKRGRSAALVTIKRTTNAVVPAA